jgi:hypothetical protein
LDGLYTTHICAYIKLSLNICCSQIHTHMLIGLHVSHRVVHIATSTYVVMEIDDLSSYVKIHVNVI